MARNRCSKPNSAPWLAPRAKRKAACSMICTAAQTSTALFSSTKSGPAANTTPRTPAPRIFFAGTPAKTRCWLRATRPSGSRSFSPRPTVSFCRASPRGRNPVGQRNQSPLYLGVSSRQVHAQARERRGHFETAKTGGASCLLARFEDCGRDSTSRPLRVHKKSANLRSVHGRIEQLILAVGPAVAAVECFPLAPSAAADARRFSGALDRLSDLIGSVGNQAPVQALRSLERSFDLVTGG